MSTDYPFPSKRMGNEKNPKLVILLENNGANASHIKWNSDYVMFKDEVYQDSGLPFSLIKQYDSWWHDMSTVWSMKFDDDEVLSLEYYPYATSKAEKDKEIYPGSKDIQWDHYAQNALTENIKILKAAMSKNAAIFIYYSANGKWYESLPELRTYSGKISHVSGSAYSPTIKKRFREFIISL